MPQAPRRTKRLAVYNHKGGVGKTTLTVNIAAALAEHGRKVLLIDSDPQCNLTSHFFDDEFVNELLDNSDKEDGRTIWTAVKPIWDGTGDINNVKPFDTVVDNVFLLPGDIRLSEFEEALGDAWTDCFKRKHSGLRATTAISRLVRKICTSGKFDVALYDAGPNIGPLNRVLILDCDYFIVPIACDLFSVRALSTLGQTLKSWILDWETISKLAPDDAYLLAGRPGFLGFIPQRYKVYGRTMAKAPNFYFRRAEKEIYSQLISVLRQIDEGLAPESTSETKLGQVKEFGTLVQSAQHQGVPLADVQGGSPEQTAEAVAAFDEIARNIIKKASVRRAQKATGPRR